MERILKKNFVKAICIFVMTFVVSQNFLGLLAFAQTVPAKVIVDGVPLNAEALNVDGYVLAPARAVLQTIGAEVNWDNNTKTFSARKGNRTIAMSLGGSTVYVSDSINLVQDEQYLKIINDTAYSQASFLCELFDYESSYDNKTQTVTITSSKSNSYAQNNLNISSKYYPELNNVLSYTGYLGVQPASEFESSEGYVFGYDYDQEKIKSYLGYLMLDCGFGLYKEGIENDKFKINLLKNDRIYTLTLDAVNSNFTFAYLKKDYLKKSLEDKGMAVPPSLQ